MKRQLYVCVLLLCSFFSQAQDLAMVAPMSYRPDITGTTSTHHRSALTSAGTWTALGGVALGVVGFIEYKGATKSSGPLTVVNVTQQANGIGLEVVGGLGIIAGVTMILIGSSNHHAHHESKVGLYSRQPNEIGIAYKL